MGTHRPRLSEAEKRDWPALRKAGAELIAWGEPGYPLRLMQLDDGPPLLAARGLHGYADTPGIAIVGARNASAIDQRFIRDIAAELCRPGFTVISGLARGIDHCVHRRRYRCRGPAGKCRPPRSNVRARADHG